VTATSVCICTKDGAEQAMRAYLSWEVALAEQMVTDDDQRFRVLAG